MTRGARRFSLTAARPLTLAALLWLPSWGSAQALPGLPPPAEPAAAAAPVPAPSPEPPAEAPDSPRASARAFLDLVSRRGDHAGAARYLAVPPELESRGPDLARRLGAVLERHLDIALDALSPLPEGSPDDDLPAGVDRLGTIPDGRGGRDPVFLARTRDGAGSRWVFSRQTVSRVDGWYDALPDRWVRDWMPAPLQLHGPGGLMWWQWLALPLLVAAALALGRALGAGTTLVLHRLFARTETAWDDRLLRRTAPSLTLLWAVAAAVVLLPWLALLPGPDALVRSLLGAVATLAVFWALWRSVDVWAEFLAERPWAKGNASARSLLSAVRNVAKALVAVGAVVAALAAFGYPVATVLAGLGIGGIALAFGAQKTIENLFGSLSIAADQPFRVGDFVRIEDFVGTVERIGMRSTQIRTLDRTLVTLPNGRLADMRVEDFASRDRIRLTTTIGVVYGTTRAQIERIVAGMEAVLRSHPLIWPDTVVVRFAGFGASSLDIEVMAWFRTSDFNVFRDCRQEALFGFMRVVEEAGSSFAFPTTTVHLVTEGRTPEPAGPAQPAT
jgi:MscS family membrane protein